MILNEGIYNDLSAEDYHADPLPEPGMSSGLAVNILKKSLLHAKHAHPKFGRKHSEPTPAMQFGSLCHAMLEDSKKILIIEEESYRTKTVKNLRDRAIQAGVIPCLIHVYNNAKAVVDQLRNQTDAFDSGDFEVSYVWRDMDIWCRARADNIDHEKLIINDYKTTGGSSNPYLWQRAQLWPEMKYIQAALYTKGMKILTGKDYRFRFIVQEVKEEPFAVSEIELDATAMAFAQDELDVAIARWREALKNLEFNGYPIITATLPKYLEAEWEQMIYKSI